MQNNMREQSPAIRGVILEQGALEQLDRAHDAGDRAAAQNAARLIDRIYEDVHATLDVIEAMYGFARYKRRI
jgi:hypothetical protein